MKPNIKKLLILNAPYLLFVYLFDKVGQAVRLSPGAGLSGKLLSIGSGFSAAFSNALPSFAPMDLLIGIVGAVVIRLAVYVKGKNAKKYRKGILNVKLTNTPLSTIAENNLTPEQLEMYRVYLQTSGNKPLIFGGGSPDTSASEDLSGVDFVNGTRPGNTAIVDLAKQQVGNVGGYPYWSWYGFNSRVEWCACFVSWCYGQMGLSEPRFAACQSQGIPWFTSHGQWGARGYENIAPGDAIFFDWDLDGSADHVGLVIGRDESRVYTVEGNSGDACKIKSYPLDYACIKGYGLMNWN